MKTSLQVVFQIVTIILIGVAVMFTTSLFNKEKSKEEIVKEVIKEVVVRRPSCPDTSESFQQMKKSGQFVVLAKNLNSYGKDGRFVNLKTTIVKTSGSGSQVACGYLYILASKGNEPLQLQWENPYVKAGQFGGHIISIDAILNREINRKTELLFNLGKIEYREERDSSEIRKADWAALLNVTDRVDFDVALNTTSINGLLDEVAIAYQCWSPETGQITKDCKLEVVE